MNFRRQSILCTTLYRHLMQASNFAGPFDQLFLWIFLWNFHRRCLSTSSIPWCKRVNNDQKLKWRGGGGGPALNHSLLHWWRKLLVRVCTCGLCLIFVKNSVNSKHCRQHQLCSCVAGEKILQLCDCLSVWRGMSYTMYWEACSTPELWVLHLKLSWVYLLQQRTETSRSLVAMAINLRNEGQVIANMVFWYFLFYSHDGNNLPIREVSWKQRTEKSLHMTSCGYKHFPISRLTQPTILAHALWHIGARAKGCGFVPDDQRLFTRSAHVRRQSFPVSSPTLNKIPILLHLSLLIYIMHNDVSSFQKLIPRDLWSRVWQCNFCRLWHSISRLPNGACLNTS